MKTKAYSFTLAALSLLAVTSSVRAANIGCVIAHYANVTYWQSVAGIKVSKGAGAIRDLSQCKQLAEAGQLAGVVGGELAGPIGALAGPVAVHLLKCACDDALPSGGVAPVELSDCGKDRTAPIPDSQYGMVSFRNEFDACLDIRTNEQSPGANIQVSKCSGVDGQRWTASRISKDGCYTFKAATGMCLDAADEALKPGGKVQSMTCNNSENQRWAVVPVGKSLGQLNGIDVFPLMLVNKKSSFCVDLRDTEVHPGGRVQLAVCNDSLNQRWQNKAVP